MAGLIENVLDFARGRLGGGFVTTRDNEMPLTPVLLQVIDELRSVHPEREVAVDIDLQEPVTCDRQRIGQLLSNLLGNAFVYGTENTPIHVRARAEDGELELSVYNAGEDIEPSALERLFQPFFRGKVRGSREGLGLGLYICSEIAKAHGGTLDVMLKRRNNLFYAADAYGSIVSSLISRSSVVSRSPSRIKGVSTKPAAAQKIMTFLRRLAWRTMRRRSPRNWKGAGGRMSMRSRNIGRCPAALVLPVR